MEGGNCSAIPMEVALEQMAERFLDHTVTYPKIDEVPFDTDRKRLAILSRTPTGNRLYVKRALETVLPLCSDVQLALDKEDITFARLGVDQKMRIVEALKRKRHVVAVTGDGVNDAPGT